MLEGGILTPSGELFSPSPEQIWQLSNAKNGQITASENNIHLHSSYNPEREAKGAVTSNDIWEKSATVFYGFALGYHVIEWVKTAKEKLSSGVKIPPKLILIEPEVNHFFAALTLLDWSEVFAYENLIIAVGCPVDSVLQLIENSKTVNIGNTGVSDAYYFDIPNFQLHSKSYFETVKKIIKRNQRKNEINAATLKKFGKLWCRNTERNLDQYEKLNGISVLENKISSLPFLIIGAGPSLEKILPELAELQKRAIIVCVETALWALLKSHIQPDFIIITDPQFWAYKHIASLHSPKSILITEISTYPSVFRFDCKKILLCSSQFPVGKWFENQLCLKLGDLGTGGSVASAAWNFAYYCGAKEIYVAGLDFSFPKKQTHIKGSSAEQNYHTLSTRLTTPEKFTASAMFNANAVEGKDYNGNKVITDSRMKMFSWWFESRLAECTDVKTYTFCPEGLCTPGITPVNVEEILQKEVILTTKEAFLQKVEDLSSPLTASQSSKLKELIPNKRILRRNSVFERVLVITQYF